MAENTVGWLAAETEALLKRSELDLLNVIEKGLVELRGQVSGVYTPGLLLAEEYLQKMRERQP